MTGVCRCTTCGYVLDWRGCDGWAYDARVCPECSSHLSDVLEVPLWIVICLSLSIPTGAGLVLWWML